MQTENAIWSDSHVLKLLNCYLESSRIYFWMRVLFQYYPVGNTVGIHLNIFRMV